MPGGERTGAWGFLPFENDDALDLLDQLEAGDAEVVRGALATAGDGYVDAPDGCVAIAAAEITSAAQGNPPGDLPENAAAWVTAHGREIGPEDVELALQVIERVGGEESELNSQQALLRLRRLGSGFGNSQIKGT